ncbi:MAG: GNAT family N-acetyltransferase [Oscillospiraceae bacterium]
MNHLGTQELATRRLVLRKFTPGDAEAMFRNWASDERVTRFLTWEPHGSQEDTKNLLTAWAAAYDTRNYNWVITLDGEAIGSIAAVRFSEQHETAEIGYCLGTAFWGRGLMTEALGAVLDFLFDEVGFYRIELHHAAKNPASGKVARKCGMLYEGTQRGRVLRHGARNDLVLYGLLKIDRA